MPSPIAHSISGYVIFKLFIIKNKKFRLIIKGLNKPLTIFLAIFVANAADLDFIVQLIIDEKFHRGLTHSLFFALLFSFIMSIIARLSTKNTTIFKQLFRLCLLLYGSHLLLDFFTVGGDGMQILWPFNHDFYKSTTPIFPSVHHDKEIFDPIHTTFITFELVYSVILYYGFWQWTKKNT